MAIDFLSLADRRLAYQRQVGNADAPSVFYLCGFATDMNGTKATFLSEQCRTHNVSFLRFDYRGCGRSSGSPGDGTIGAWLQDALDVYDHLTFGPQIVVGSSMGGWLGMMLAAARPERVKAFIGIAAAPDFMEDLVWERLNDAQRAEVVNEGFITYDGNPTQPFPITLTMIEEARNHLILRNPFSMPCPARLIQGTKDDQVPYEHATRLAKHIGGDTKVITIEGGDHRLGTPEQMMVLWQTIGKFLK